MNSLDNPLKAIVSHLMLDIDDYLSYIEDYGKPNPKYFNFVLKKMGIMQIFLHKYSIIRSCAIKEFIERLLLSLKTKFIAESSSSLKQAGIIFLLNKIYFTDDVAIGLKFRLIAEEWEHFKKFFYTIQHDKDYLDSCIMLHHLFTEGFFKFTIKTRKLALDYGQPENALGDDLIDPTKSKVFWKEIKEQLMQLEHKNVEELKKLAEIRDEALQTFDEVLPEKASLDECLETFEALKSAVEKLSAENPKKATRREMIQTCKDYLQHTTNDDENITFRGLPTDDNDDIDYESIAGEVTKKSKRKRNLLTKKRTRRKKNKPKDLSTKPQEGVSESESDSQKLPQKRVPYGFVTQKAMLENYADKLKQCYQ